MDDEKYQALEKKFHSLPDVYLRQLSSESGIQYGSPAAVCKEFVDKVGLAAAEESFTKFQETNNIELVTSAYFDAEDLDKGSLPIPVNFVEVQDLYPPGQTIECKLELEEEFVSSISRRDWVGLFEVGWKYLHSYITFEWVSTLTKLEDGKSSMIVKFNSRTLPTKPKDEGHVFCYITRTGDVLGVSAPFHFKNPGLSFTDPDTFLVQDDMFTSINNIASPPSMDILSMNSPTSPAVVCPTFQDMDSAHDTILEERDQLKLERDLLEQHLSEAKERMVTQDSEIEALQTRISELQAAIAAKTQQQEEVENYSYDSLRGLEKEIIDMKIAKQLTISLNKDLEEKILEYTMTIRTQEVEIHKIRQQLTDSQDVLEHFQNEVLQNTHDASAKSDHEAQLLERIQTLSREKSVLEQNLAKVRRDQLDRTRLHKTTSEDLPKLHALVKSKDAVIAKLTIKKRDSDATLVLLQSETNKYKDDYKRLMNEMTECIKKLKDTEAQLYTSEKAVRQLEANKNELVLLEKENNSLEYRLRIQEEKNKRLETIKFSLGSDGEIAAVTVLSLQARIAQLEHQNSHLEAQLVSTQLDLSEIATTSSDTSNVNLIQEEKQVLQFELAEKDKVLEAFKKRAEDIEINFREGIKDLRSQLVTKTMELEQRNEMLADKGEIIDGLRTECQERRETDRYNKHRIAQGEKKLGEESDSYHQIISDLQSQLSGYTNAHIQFDRHELIKCPFCPAAYEKSMQSTMEAHIMNKHPF